MFFLLNRKKIVYLQSITIKLQKRNLISFMNLTQKTVKKKGGICQKMLFLTANGKNMLFF